MGSTSLIEKMVIVVLTIATFVVIVPTYTFATENPKSTSISSHYNFDNHPNNFNLSSLSSPSKGIFGKKCRKPLKEVMVIRVIEHLKAPRPVKLVLEKSAKFSNCIAGKFCSCMRLGFKPLIYACFGVIAVVCMKHIAISDPHYHCTLDCANTLINTSHTLDNEAIGGLCYRKCVKSV